MSLFLADGVPGMSCVTTPRLGCCGGAQPYSVVGCSPVRASVFFARPLRWDGLCAEGPSRCTRPAKMRWDSDAVRLTSCRRSPRDGN